ncbi:MAG: putative acetyl-CoA acyltransferase [Acidimicrobiaceae bacterium]|nr:putative acetyl-CoA acyltransferase [Acidimicrobiaceae bacterium]
MYEAVIVDAVRTAGGKRNGRLRDWHPGSLAAFVLNALADRNGLDPALVDDVILGCVTQVNEQAANIARSAVLAANWPETVPGITIDRQCGSSQQAMHFAAQGVMSGAYDVVIAAGVESMTRVPMGSSFEGVDVPWPPEEISRYATTGLPNQGLGAELIADEYGLSRFDLDTFSALSQEKALLATKEGKFDGEIVPVPVDLGGGIELHVQDEGIRPGTTVETLGALKPAFKEGGKITAGNSSQICDGASAVLIMSAEKSAALGLRPRARFHSFAVAGTDPVTMLKGPIPATAKILAKSGLTLDEIDVIEINEAFAPVVLAWQIETGADMSKVNPNGGAIALGHPLGSSGTKLMATLLNELERRGGRYGLQLMCEAGGMANATLVERLDV